MLRQEGAVNTCQGNPENMGEGLWNSMGDALLCGGEWTITNLVLGLHLTPILKEHLPSPKHALLALRAHFALRALHPLSSCSGSILHARIHTALY